MTNQFKTKQQVFDGYEVLDQHSGGTTATIYKIGNSAGDKYCVKIYNDNKAEIFPKETTIKEAHLVKHDIPYLVKVYEVGKFIENGKEVHYSVMEYVNGIALDEYINSKEYDSSFVEHLAKRLCRANNLLLERNLAHRDIKTSNVVIDKEGNGVLVDLGLLSRTDTEELTDKEKAFLDEELKEVFGSLKPLTKEMLPRYWRAITLFQIGRVINDVLVRKGKVTFRDIKNYLEIEYEVRLICYDNNKILALIATLKHWVKLLRRIRLNMSYFK